VDAEGLNRAKQGHPGSDTSGGTKGKTRTQEVRDNAGRVKKDGYQRGAKGEKRAGERGDEEPSAKDGRIEQTQCEGG